MKTASIVLDTDERDVLCEALRHTLDHFNLSPEIYEVSENLIHRLEKLNV